VIIPITSYVAVSLFNTGVGQQAEITINKELDATSRIFYGRLDNLLLYLDSLTYNLCLRDTFAHGEPGLREALQDIKGHRNLSFAYMLAPDGTILASTNNPSLTGEVISQDSFMSRFLSDQSRKGVVVLDEGFLEAEGLAEKAAFTVIPTAETGESIEETRGLGLVAAVPCYDAEGNINSFLLAGELLNRDENFVDEIQELLKVYATIFLDDLRIATSIRLTNGERALGTRVSPEVAAVVLDEGRRYMGQALIIDENYLTAYDPLIDDQGEIIGMLFVGIPEAPFVAMKEHTIKQYIYISFLSIFLALIIAYSMSRKITRPLQEMTNTMQKVELGDLSQRFAPRADTNIQTIGTIADLKELWHKIGIRRHFGNERDDEVQRLGSFFNRMMDSLQRNWERNRQLQESLEEKEQIRVELIKKMINIQEDERKRIARELHDETSQSLTSLLLMLKTVQQTNDVKSIQKLAVTSREVIYNTLEEVQKISYELRPMALDKLGIDEALQRYIGDIGQHWI
jgi:signal transduction histidine kinase